MLIAVDIGNSSINIGYFADKGLVVQNIATHPLRNADEYALILNDFFEKNSMEKHCLNVIISSVVPGHTVVFNEVFNKLTEKEAEILMVSHTINTGLAFKVNAPEELGTDRIANAAGAYRLYKSPVAVLDFGTATTVTAVDRHANYIGGAIMPGLGLMNDILDKGTSGLKKIAMEPPSSALGKDTAGCIKSGLFYGTAGAVERVLEEMEKEAECKFNIIITGGYGRIMDKFLQRPHNINTNLIFEGLRILYEINRSA